MDFERERSSLRPHESKDRNPHNDREKDKESRLRFGVSGVFSVVFN
jgi:hypothetical protein